MHNVRTRKPPRHASAKARDKRLPPVPPGASSPFLLASAPPGFPRDVAVPPHRGALIELAATPDRPVRARKEYLVTPAPRQPPAAEARSTAPARKPRKPRAAAAVAPKIAEAGTTTPRKKKATGQRTKGAATRVAAPKAGTSAKSAPAATAVRAAASRRPRMVELQGPDSPPAVVPATGPLTVPVTVTVNMPNVELIVARLASTLARTGDSATPCPDSAATDSPDPVVLPTPAVTAAATRFDPAPAALAPAAAVAVPRPPLARDRALVRTSTGLVSRVVAWLGRLVPRQRRAALPRVRTRIAQSAAAPPAAEPLESDLARRMLLQLSEENDRLRVELDRMRSAAARLPRA